jgi:membrane protease YdiL (CAAX protease family)
VWVVLRIVVVIAAVVVTQSGLVFYVVLALAIADAYVRRAVRTGRSLADIGLDPNRAAAGLASGFALGAAAITITVALFAVLGWYRYVEFAPGGGFSRQLGAAFVFFALVAVVEELLFRGMLFRFVELKTGSWLAIAFSAAAFGLTHYPNPNASLRSSVGLMIEAGVLFAAIYLATRSLWTCIGLHWSWNLFEGPVFGMPVSGQQFDVLTRAEIDGPELWTGGSFGPEAGLVLIVLGGLLGAVLLVHAHGKGHFVDRPSRGGSRSGSAPESEQASA